MSTSAKRAFLFAGPILLLAMAAIAGFRVGLMPSEKASVSLEPQQNAGPLVLEQPYQLTQPTIGLLQQTLPVTFEPATGDQVAIIEQDTRLQEGMPVILYDDHNQAWPHKGEVAMAEGEKTIVILPKSEKKAVRGDVILREDFMARRLPVDALHQGRIWKAIPMMDGTYMAESIETDEPALSNAVHFALNAPLIRADEYAIANPDDQLQDGAIITTVSIIKIDAPVADAQQEAAKRVADEYVERLVAAINMSPPPQLFPRPAGTSCPVPAAIPVPPDIEAR